MNDKWRNESRIYFIDKRELAKQLKMKQKNKKADFLECY